MLTFVKLKKLAQPQLAHIRNYTLSCFSFSAKKSHNLFKKEAVINPPYVTPHLSMTDTLKYFTLNIFCI